jgi:PAS domain S-box-containing protein
MKILKDRKSAIKSIAFAILLAGILIGAVAYFISDTIRNEIRQGKFNDIAAIADLKAKEISRWISERTYEGLFLQQNPDFRELLLVYLSDTSNLGLRNKIGEWVHPILSNHDYSAMHLYNANNALLAAFVVDDSLGKTFSGFEHLDVFYNVDSISFGEIYFDSAVNHCHFNMYVPMLKGSTSIGTIVLSINPEMVLFPALMDLPVHSETFETFLAKQEADSVVYITRLRFIDNEPLNFKVKAGSTHLFQGAKAIPGHEGFFAGTDYRRKKATYTLRKIPPTAWYLVSKIDVREIYTPAVQSLIIILLLGVLLLTAIGAVLITIWKRNEAHLLRRQLALEKETKALEKHYWYLTKYANDIIMLANQKGELIQLNEKGLERYGYTEQEIQGMNIGRLRAKHTLKQLPGQIREVIDKGFITLESVHVTKSDREFPVEVRARSIKIDDTVFIQSIVRDISRRKMYERTILERENNLEITLQSIGDAVIVTDHNGVVTRMNGVAEQLTGWKSTDAINKPVEEVMVIWDAIGIRDIRNIVDKVLQEGNTYSLDSHAELVSRDGSILKVSDSAAPIKDQDGKLMGTVIVFRDVTEKFKQELVLRESEEKFRLLAESSPVAILIYQDTRWVYANPGATTITGYSAEELLEMNYWDIVHPEDRLMIKERGVMRQSGHQVPQRYQFRIKTKDSLIRWVDLSGTLINFKGKPAGMISVMDITEQREAMLKIAERESRLSSIFKAAPVGIGFVIDRVIMDVNDRVCQMTGYSHEELNGKDARMLYASDEAYEYVGREIYKQINENGIGEVETRWKHKNGSLSDIQLRSVALDPDDKSKGFMYTALDITERKRSEQSIMESRRTLMTLMSNLQGIVYRCLNDQEWTMLFLSDGFKTITGFDPNDYTGSGKKKYVDLIHSDDRQKIWQDVQKALQVKAPYELEFRFKHASGDYIWVWEKGRGVFDTDGNLLFLEGIVSDISWRKHNEEIQHVIFNIANAVNITNNLSELAILIKNELAKVIDTENFLIALYDDQANTITIPFATDRNDHSQALQAGKTLAGYVISNNIPMLANKEQINEIVNDEMINFDGVIPESCLGVPLQYRDHVIGALVMQDYDNPAAFTINELEIMKFVSSQVALSIERKKNEIELKIAKEKAIESDKLKTAFLANMSHEIRTPMNAIIGFSDLLADTAINQPDRNNFLNIIQNNGNVLLNLIDDIIDMAKLEAGQLRIERKLTRVDWILDELFSYFAEYRNKMNKSHIDVRFTQKNSKIIEIVTDPLRFRQIISNLINNALKFTEEGFVELGYLFELPQSAPLGSPVNAVVFYVKDSGVGIPEDKLTMVFDRFRQAYDSHSQLFGGTGLGLTISRNLATMLGGTIWVESKSGVGSVFYVALPFQEHDIVDSLENDPGDTKTNMIDATGKKILLVDDDPSSLLFLRKIIEKTGATIFTAGNGSGAINICNQQPDIDLVFMDIRMPGMDGYEVAKRIKAKYPFIPVVAQTAYAMPEEIRKSTIAGFDSHITKPLKQSEVFAAIKKFCPLIV